MADQPTRTTREDIEEELYEAVEIAMHGKPMTPQVAGSIKLAALGVLQRHGLRGQIQVLQRGTSFEVRIDLPPETPLVQEIRLRLGR